MEVHPNQLNNNVNGPKHNKTVAGAQKLFSITSSYPKCPHRKYVPNPI